MSLQVTRNQLIERGYKQHTHASINLDGYILTGDFNKMDKEGFGYELRFREGACQIVYSFEGKAEHQAIIYHDFLLLPILDKIL